MNWHADPRYRAGGFWACVIRERERERARYHAKPFEQRQHEASARYERMMSDPRRAFRKRVREVEVYHRKRLAELSTAVTEEAV